MRDAIPPLHVVTDDRVLTADGFARQATAVLREGGPALALHLRGRTLTGRRLHELAAGLRDRCTATGSRLVINDRVDVALAVQADGVHLPEGGMPPERVRRMLPDGCGVGRSIHRDGAALADVDWLFAGNVFRTASHPDRPAAGVEWLREVATGPVPVIAIGGVMPEGIPAVRGCGAAGVAVLGGIWNAPDPAGAVRTYLEAWDAA